jgi:hypothetical protein
MEIVGIDFYNLAYIADKHEFIAFCSMRVFPVLCQLSGVVWFFTPEHYQILNQLIDFHCTRASRGPSVVGDNVCCHTD